MNQQKGALSLPLLSLSLSPQNKRLQKALELHTIPADSVSTFKGTSKLLGKEVGRKEGAKQRCAFRLPTIALPHMLPHFSSV